MQEKNKEKAYEEVQYEQENEDKSNKKYKISMEI